MGIFSVFKRGLKKTRDEGITAQLDEVVDCRLPKELSVI